jgi:hypothetical protein
MMGGGWYTNGLQQRAYPVQVTWRPPQTFLHYEELYRGIPEYLRAPPVGTYATAAVNYLGAIYRNIFPDMPSHLHCLQNHRVLWIREWLYALPDDASECSDTDTVVGEDRGMDYDSGDTLVEEVW